ncbi:MAG: lipocalin family protein [Cellvibrionaceae bacterium]
MIKKLSFATFAFLALSGCLGFPEGVDPVNQFDVNRYVGKWYEIARLDHSFERGLSNVTAEYELRDDGGVTVVNRGFSIEEQNWSEATGKAYFVEAASTGYLKVSFFGPFYGSYAVFELGDNYEYAFVSGNTTNYLWLLSRTPTVSDTLLEKFISASQRLGFETSQLILVDHRKVNQRKNEE